MNYAVSKPFPSIGKFNGWVDGSRDQSIIKIPKSELLYISMQYQPTDWNSGKWVLKNMLETSNYEYLNIENIIKNSPQLQITINDDIVDFGRKIIKYLIDNI